MRPFLFLGTRGEDAAADGEYTSVLSFSGLREDQLRRVRLEREPLPEVDLEDWSGIILGGGPFNVSDPAEAKSPVQRRVAIKLVKGGESEEFKADIAKHGSGEQIKKALDKHY